MTAKLIDDCFVLDKDRKIEAIYESVDPKTHSAELLERLREG